MPEIGISHGARGVSMPVFLALHLRDSLSSAHCLSDVANAR
jgi:hypothetical protein